ncbi:hypothetical protein PGT21_018833, partial [Puccinia graminis f. sp. tritici]
MTGLSKSEPTVPTSLPSSTGSWYFCASKKTTAKPTAAVQGPRLESCNKTSVCSHQETCSSTPITQSIQKYVVETKLAGM